MPPQTFPIVPVFVSSTWLDLRPERGAVEDALQRLRTTKYVGMEFFGSRDETTRGASLDEVDRSLVYVGIFAARYGSGITEAEYRRARERGLSCFIYFKADATVAEGARETDPAGAAKLGALKDELIREHGVSTFDNPDDLAARVTADLHRWLFDEHLPNLSAPPLPTLHQLRAPVGDFVGREKEINELLKTLRGGGSAAITGISGMGGIGKTELSYYVAERLRDTYPDAQLVLDMRGTDERPRDPADALAACIRAFHGLETRLPDDTEELTKIYRSTLEGRRVLILLDNVHDGAQARPLLPPAGCALLVTSRGAVTLPGMKTRLTLDQLSPDEARGLLTGIAPHVPDETADRICELCGHLPLAIRAAGSLLEVTADLDPEDYAAQLGDERKRLEFIGAEGVDISVEASFNLSYSRLSPDAARVFGRLAVFPASFDAAAEEAVCEDENHKHLSDLLRRSLTLYNPGTRRYRLHDLARLFADSRMGEGERLMTGMRHSAHYASLLRKAHELYRQGGDAITRGLALLDLEWRNKDRRGEAAALGNLGMAYVYLDETQRSIELSEQYLVIAREVGDRRGEGIALNNIGIAYNSLGETRRAVDFFEQSLTIARELGDMLGEARALLNTGGLLGKLGDQTQAVARARAALEIYEQLESPHAETARAMLVWLNVNATKGE